MKTVCFFQKNFDENNIEVKKIFILIILILIKNLYQVIQIVNYLMINY